MIERLPLDLFEDPDSSDEVEVDQAVDQNSDEEAGAGVVLVTCQWCAEAFDNELQACPACGAKHITITAPEEDPETVICQWCLVTFEPGPENCPSCNARVVVPGQHVLGENDPFPDFTSRGMLARQAQSHQLLAGMMAGGVVDSFAAGLIGLVITLLDDD